MKARNEKVDDTTDNNAVISPLHNMAANKNQPPAPLRPEIKKQAAQKFVYREPINTQVPIEEPIVPTTLFNDENALENQTASRWSCFDVEDQSITVIGEETIGVSAENHWVDLTNQTRTSNSSSLQDIEMGEWVDPEINIYASSQSIEMTPMHANKKNEQNTPDSQITTAPNTPDNDEEVNNAISQIPEANYVQNLQAVKESIANRIVKKHELRYMANLPELTDENRAEYKFMSIITAEGLFQLNREFHEFRCILNIEQLIEVAPDLGNAINMLKHDSQLPPCGLVKMPQAPQSYSLTELKRLINKKPAYVLVDKNLYYIGFSFNINLINVKKDITELESLFGNELQIATTDSLVKITSLTGHTQLAYDDLTIEQLKSIEQLIRDQRNYTIIGYSINEEVFLRMMGSYPPAPDAFSLRVLNTIHLPIVRDTSLSIRSAAQASILFGYMAIAFLEYDPKEQGSYFNFYYNNVQWYLTLTMGVFAINMGLLHSHHLQDHFSRIPSFDRKTALSIINRIRLIENSIIGKSQNWITYGSLVRLPQYVIGYGIFPVIAYGAYTGLYDADELYTTSVINIANNTALKTFWKGLLYALTIGSFVSFGLSYVTFDIITAHRTADDVAVTEYFNDLSYIQYAACVTALSGHLMRYPHFSSSCQRYGRFLSNVSNSMGNVMLDNYAIFVIISMTVGLTIGNNISADQQGLLTLFYGLQLVTFLYSFATTFAATPDLAEFSVEPNSSTISLASWCHLQKQRIRQTIQQLNQFLASPNRPKTDASVELKPFSTKGLFANSMFINPQNDIDDINESKNSAQNDAHLINSPV